VVQISAIAHVGLAFLLLLGVTSGVLAQSEIAGCRIEPATSCPSADLAGADLFTADLPGPPIPARRAQGPVSAAEAWRRSWSQSAISFLAAGEQRRVVGAAQAIMP